MTDFAAPSSAISDDRWFLDRGPTHIRRLTRAPRRTRARWYVEGNFESYEANKVERLGADAARPHRVTYRKLAPATDPPARTTPTVA